MSAVDFKRQNKKKTTIKQNKVYNETKEGISRGNHQQEKLTRKRARYEIPKENQNLYSSSDLPQINITSPQSAFTNRVIDVEEESSSEEGSIESKIRHLIHGKLLKL
jgi:hypothetical protein